MRINLKIVLLILVLLALAAGLVVNRCALKKRNDAYHKDIETSIERIPATDTVRVEKLDEVHYVRPIVVAPMVMVETKPDAVGRSRMERSTIITSVEKRAPKRTGLFRRPVGVDSLHIRTISPAGIVAQGSYPWRWVEHGNFTVDSAGRLHLDPIESEKAQRKAIRRSNRKQTWRTVVTVARTVGTVAAVAGSLALGILIAR